MVSLHLFSVKMGIIQVLKSRKSEQTWPVNLLLMFDVVGLACGGKRDNVTTMPESRKRSYGTVHVSHNSLAFASFVLVFPSQ